MLRFGFILLVATSALAAPSVSYAPTFENAIVELSEDIGVAQNTGAANHLTDAIFSYKDGGETNLYMITLQNIINDIASGKSKKGQSLALAQALIATMAQATGIPGDACMSSEFINQYASGNYRKALYNFVQHIAKNLDILVRFRKNPQQARYQTGPVSHCKNGGRTYAFEAAWDAIIANVTPVNTELVKEQYCTVKRMYNSFNVLNNNIAAVVTATSVPPVAQIYEQIFPQLINFAIAFVENRNLGSALSAIQSALLQCV